MTIIISIIIPTYKRHTSLEKTLMTVDRYRPVESEVIVVDQSPNNSLRSIDFCKQFPYIKYLCLSSPGLPDARNEGIKNSSGKIIFFMDDDAILDPACLNEHITFHAQNGTYALAGRIKQMGDISWAKTTKVTEINDKTGEAIGNFDLDNEGEVLYASGGHFSVKRDLFKKVGFFNAQFRGNALYEDVEFFARVRKNGYPITYNPRAIVYHYPENYGGCHENDGARYLYERLYNHMLFYILHISLVPSRECTIYMKNLIEYISRRKNRGHNPFRIVLCLLSIAKAYRSAFLSVFNKPKLT